MQKLPRKAHREPIIAPGGIGRLLQVVALVLISIWVTSWLKPITDAAVHAGYHAVGLVPPSARHTHP